MIRVLCVAASKWDRYRPLRRRTRLPRRRAFPRDCILRAAARPHCSASATSTLRPAVVRPSSTPPGCLADLRRKDSSVCLSVRRIDTTAAARRLAARQLRMTLVGPRTRQTSRGERQRSARRRTSSRPRRGWRRYKVAASQLMTSKHWRPFFALSAACATWSVVRYHTQASLISSAAVPAAAAAAATCVMNNWLAGIQRQRVYAEALAQLIHSLSYGATHRRHDYTANDCYLLPSFLRIAQIALTIISRSMHTPDDYRFWLAYS